jgi:cell division protease FtsH
MGSTVSSYSTAKRLEVGAPGGGQGGNKKKGQDPEAELRRALADRIEDQLAVHLQRAREILRDERRAVLTLANALETHKTLTGDDVVAILEGRPGPIIDGTAYHDPDFARDVEAYHEAALAAHQRHGHVQLALPAPPGALPAPPTDREVAEIP